MPIALGLRLLRLDLDRTPENILLERSKKKKKRWWATAGQFIEQKTKVILMEDLKLDTNANV